MYNRLILFNMAVLDGAVKSDDLTATIPSRRIANPAMGMEPMGKAPKICLYYRIVWSILIVRIASLRMLFLAAP
jgi:hypothetical protein